MITKFYLKKGEFQIIMSQHINIWNIIACLYSPLKCTQCTLKKKLKYFKKYLYFEPYSKILFDRIVFYSSIAWFFDFFHVKKFPNDILQLSSTRYIDWCVNFDVLKKK